MRRKYSFMFFFIVLLLPWVNILDNIIISSNKMSYFPTECPVELITCSNQFEITVHVGDPFSNPYGSFEFNPNEKVTITGTVKNLAYTGGTPITIAIWLVTANSPYQIMYHIQNLTGSIPLGMSYSFKDLNANHQLNWSINYFYTGTYRFKAQVFIGGVGDASAITGKPVILRQLRVADFRINSTIIDKIPHFTYNLTNKGNSAIVGYLDIKIQEFQQFRTSWSYYMDVNDSTHQSGELISLGKGASLVGTATWNKPSGISGIYRLYMALRDSNGKLLYNLNSSMPFAYSGSMYIDSDKTPKLEVQRHITAPSRFLTTEKLNVTLHITVVGITPTEIGLMYFGISPTQIIQGVKNVRIVEKLNDAVIPPAAETYYWVNGTNQGRLASSARSGNKFYFNSTTKGCQNLSALLVGQTLEIKYNILANFTPEISRPLLTRDETARKVNVGFDEELLSSNAITYETIRLTVNRLHILPADKIQAKSCIGHVGVIVYAGRLDALYGTSEYFKLRNSLLAWIGALPFLYQGVIYYVDDYICAPTALSYMGLTPTQIIEYNSLTLYKDKANYLFNQVDRKLITLCIEELVTSAIEENGWDYIMLVGADEVIPMRIIENPLFPYFDYNSSLCDPEVATDFFYGDLTPESELDTAGYIPEIVVSRLAGRNPQEMIQLLKAGNVTDPSSGRALFISNYKAEDTIRNIAEIWNESANGFVKWNDTLYDTNTNFTTNKMIYCLDPNSSRYGNDPSTFPYALVLYADHGSLYSFHISDEDVDKFSNYVDGHRPFIFLYACLSGWIGDPGLFQGGDAGDEFDVSRSLALEYLSKGIAGMVASTRTSYSPGLVSHYGVLLGENYTKPIGCPDTSKSGVYPVGKIWFEGKNVSFYLVDPTMAGTYAHFGIDFNDNGRFDDIYNGRPEYFNDSNHFFEKLSEPLGTYPWRYYAGRYSFSSWNIVISCNGPAGGIDKYTEFFIGTAGGGIMQGANVGTAFLNAQKQYWAYSKLTSKYTDEGVDKLTLLEHCLYGVPIYKPTFQDPPLTQNYTVHYTNMNDWGFNVTLGVHNYKHSGVAGEDLFEIQGALLTSGENQPELPLILTNISIPAGFSISSIQILGNNSYQLPGTYTISLCTPYENNSQTLLTNAASNSGLNTNDQLSGVYPETLYNYILSPEQDGTSTLYLALFPFSWNADTKKVTFYQNLTLHVKIQDSLQDSVSLAISKSVTAKQIGRGSNFHIQLNIANNGSNTVYNLQFSENTGEQQNFVSRISSLSPSGINSSALIGFLVSAPLTYFSGWVSTTTILTYQDGAGTMYSMTVAASVYLETWIGIIILILCLTIAIAITVIILKAHK